VTFGHSAAVPNGSLFEKTKPRCLAKERQRWLQQTPLVLLTSAAKAQMFSLIDHHTHEATPASSSCFSNQRQSLATGLRHRQRLHRFVCFT
jgi:hypothetical protein